MRLRQRRQVGRGHPDCLSEPYQPRQHLAVDGTSVGTELGTHPSRNVVAEPQVRGRQAPIRLEGGLQAEYDVLQAVKDVLVIEFQPLLKGRVL